MVGREIGRKDKGYRRREIARKDKGYGRKEDSKEGQRMWNEDSKE
jgi:hypothetical protein